MTFGSARSASRKSSPFVRAFCEVLRMSWCASCRPRPFPPRAIITTSDMTCPVVASILSYVSTTRANCIELIGSRVGS